MATVNTYLMFNGNCEEAFEFYKNAFGKEYDSISRFGDMPSQEGMPPMDEMQKKRIMNISLPISKETVLMGSDTMPGMNDAFTLGDNFSIAIGVESKEEADKLFNALAIGGNVTMPLAMTFWNAYFGMWTDRFGINWMVNYDLPK